ncbi:MAG TPA: extracellular solute-binding protein [Candidatus Alectryocaccomicrobium excrementavium]|uniref:Extracellular solute-binding protein n=1 Tax=Candidatus Alectryocaccomicrobium excrementavium TaxID=2840668 RepID=A0A9D1FZZ9_9FIRM|nr:extracellular solute-binding protein [Candidatus Alectryocaccomicrobium excrementavium]
MKKWISVLLALCLLAVSGAGALAAPGDAVLVYEGMEGFDEQVQSMAYADGTLYILGYNSLYTYADGALTQWELDVSVENEESDVYVNFNPSALVNDGGEIRLLGMERGYDVEAEESLVEGGGLYSISLEEADGIKTARVELATELDFEAMIEDSGDEYTWMNISMPFAQDGMLVGTTYGVNNIFWFDLEDGSYHSFGNEYLGLLAPYKDGRVLALQADYSSAEPRVELCALDLESEEVEALCEMPMDGYSAPSMLYYDAQADLLYYVSNGELWRMPLTDPAAAESVADMPLNYSGQAQPVLTEDGYFIVADYETVVRRNTDPSQRAQTRIVVQDAYADAVDRAYYAFTGANPDVEVVKKDVTEDIVQAMMSQSSDIDIYVLGMSGAEFATLLDRGYAVELGGSEKITGLVGQMYPALAEGVSRDGMVYALPLEIYSRTTMGYDMEAFQRLGLSEEDVPTTWDELLDLLIALPDYMANDEDVSMFEPYVTQEDARESLFSMILDNYLLYIDQPDQEFTLDTPLLRGLLEKLETVDFEALGLISRDEAGTSFSWSAEPGDFMFSMTASIDVYNYDNFTPMLLGFEEGVPGMMSVQVNAALVNPFSQNVETAIAFLETVADNLDEIFRIQTMPGENTPVRSSYYEENMESYEEQLAYLRESLESAEDEETRATYEQNIAEMEGYMQEYEEEDSWEVSAASIDHYRGYAENMVVPSNMDDAEFYELRMQYVDGLIGMDEMISKIDQRLTMMRMEGY